MKEHEKKYNEWKELKEIINELDFLLPFDEREIWWMSCGVNIGIEIDGKGDSFERPVLIIKKYNKEHMWVIPINSSTTIRAGINLPIYHPNLNKNSVASISQLQSKSSRRLVSLIGTLSIVQFIKVLEAIKETLPKYTKDLA